MNAIKAAQSVVEEEVHQRRPPLLMKLPVVQAGMGAAGAAARGELCGVRGASAHNLLLQRGCFTRGVSAQPHSRAAERRLGAADRARERLRSEWQGQAGLQAACQAAAVRAGAETPVAGPVQAARGVRSCGPVLTAAAAAACSGAGQSSNQAAEPAWAEAWRCVYLASFLHSQVVPS